MDWKRFAIVFLRSVVLVTVAAVLVLGVFGFLVAGREGMINGAGWGLILGLVSVPFTAFIIYSRYWGDFAGRLGAAHLEYKDDEVEE